MGLTNLQLRDERLSWQFDLDGIVRDLDNIATWPSLPGTYNGDTLFVKGQRSRYVRSIHLGDQFKVPAVYAAVDRRLRPLGPRGEAPGDVRRRARVPRPRGGVSFVLCVSTTTFRRL